MVTAAIIGLVTDRRIEIVRTETLSTSLWRRGSHDDTVYLISPCLPQPRGAAEGRLEFAIMTALLGPGRERRAASPTLIVDLAGALMEASTNGPGRWLADIVAGEAEERRLGHIRGVSIGARIEWATDSVPSLEEALPALTRIKAELEVAAPGFMLQLSDGVNTAIKARTGGGE